jgi:group I intron endonuclease
VGSAVDLFFREREDFYLQLIKPEYNILQKAGSTLGYRHSEESKTIMSENNTGEKNPMFGKKHSDETLQQMSDIKKGEKNPCFGRTGEDHPMFGKKHSEETKKNISYTMQGHKGAAQSTSQQISVTDVKTNTTTFYN